MATKATNVLTLMDWAKRRDPDGNTADIVEMLNQTNEILTDALWKEGNLPMGHQTTMRTGLPTPAWRLLNQGTQPSKSTTAQVTEATGILESWSEVDKEVADLEGNTNEFRLSEATAHIEAMNQEMAQTMFYGNTATAPEEYTGLSARFSDTTAANGSNIVSGGGSDTDLMSIWLIGWSAATFFGIFPKGSKAGLQHKDLGEVTIQTSTAIAGTRLRGYQDYFQWKCGVACRDWRYIVRIPNIDKSVLVANSSPADLTLLMTKAIWRIPNLGLVKPVFYMNRTCGEFLDIQRQKAVKDGGGITYENVDGQRRMSFRGIPVRISDALLESETTVS
jgi:hypothetical protein